MGTEFYECIRSSTLATVLLKNTIRKNGYDRVILSLFFLGQLLTHDRVNLAESHVMPVATLLSIVLFNRRFGHLTLTPLY